MFDDQTQYSPISKLSGGEKRRLHLMYILYQNPNFLIFDEPTNDLDLPTLTVLENFLQNFQGSLIIVSHDRYFMDRIVDHVLAFEGEGKIKEFVGNFSEYRESQKSEDRSQKTEKLEVGSRKSEETSTPLSVANQQPITSNQQPKKKLSFKEQRELETIEKEMPKLEEKRAEILEQLNNESDYEKILKLSSELELLSGKLEEHELRWLELQE